MKMIRLNFESVKRFIDISIVDNQKEIEDVVERLISGDIVKIDIKIHKSLIFHKVLSKKLYGVYKNTGDRYGFSYNLSERQKYYNYKLKIITCENC